MYRDSHCIATVERMQNWQFKPLYIGSMEFEMSYVSAYG